MPNAYSLAPPQIANSKGKSKYLALMFDKQIYLFNQAEIYSFESLIDVQNIDNNNNVLGVVKVSGYDVPVYCLDDDLAVMKSVPPSRSVCVIFKSFSFALLCKDIRVLEYNEMVESELPECMYRPYMPVSGICIYKNTVNHDNNYAMLISSKALEEYIVKYNRY